MAEVYAISERHDIANLAGEALFKCVLVSEDSEVAQKFKKAMLASVVRYQRLCLELKKVSEVLEENGISYMPLKGTVIRKYYPDPWMRTSGDIDILVKKEDSVRGAELLETKLDYTKVHKEKRTEHDFGYYAPNGTPVELHYDLMEKDANNVVVKHKFSFSCSADFAWDRAEKAENSEYKYKMSKDVFYIYHISHMAKHFINGGCGIRPFIDLWILNNLGWGENDFVKESLKNDGIMLFWEKANELTKVWFEDKAHSEITQKMESFILDGGVHGNSENKMKLLKIKKNSKWRFFLSIIFVPYKTLRYRYKGLEKYPFLLPFYWVRRWFENIFKGKLKNVARDNSSYNAINEDEMGEMKKMLSDLDII